MCIWSLGGKLGSIHSDEEQVGCFKMHPLLYTFIIILNRDSRQTTLSICHRNWSWIWFKTAVWLGTRPGREEIVWAQLIRFPSPAFLADPNMKNGILTIFRLTEWLIWWVGLGWRICLGLWGDLIYSVWRIMYEFNRTLSKRIVYDSKLSRGRDISVVLTQNLIFPN